MADLKGRVCELLPALVASALLVAASESSALTFQADFSATTYQVVGGDSYPILLAAHQAGTLLSSTSMTGFENVSAQVEAGVTTDYSILLSANLTIASAGQYVFQVGTDWGRGGVAAVIDESTSSVIDELVRTDDVWWGNDWNDPDVFTTTVDLTAGTNYTLAWLGFEDCCAGVTTIRFSYEGGPFQILNDANLQPLTTPEPGSALLLASGLALFAVRRSLRR